jgi:restriction system protein
MKTRKIIREILDPKPTPNGEFRMPILRALIEMGGSGNCNDVLDRVHEMVRDRLNSTDYTYSETVSVPKWRHAAQWERNTMKDDGLIKKGSPRGIWEITSYGKEYYNSHKS